MTTEERIELEDGKYTLINDRGALTALRYGEPWRDMCGDKLIGAMFSRIAELEQEKAELKAKPPQKSELEKDAANLLFALHDAWPSVHRFSTIDSVRKRIQWLMHKHGGFADLFPPNPAADIELATLELLRRANALGLVVTIEHKPLTPLAMGNYRAEVSVRPKRETAA